MMASVSALKSMLKSTKFNLPFYNKRPIFLSFRSSKWFITVVVCTAIFTDVFLYSVIVPVFPFSLPQRIGVPEKDVQHWLSVLLAVYAAALLVGAPIFGWLADKMQYRKWPLLIGLICIFGATLLLCLAKTLPLLIIGRVLQGLSASVIWVVGLALMADTVGSEGLAVGMGYVCTAYSVGTLVGPVLGGVIYAKCGYYAVFAVTFSVVGLDIILRLVMIEKREAKKWTDEDLTTEGARPPHPVRQLSSDSESDVATPVARNTGHDIEKTPAPKVASAIPTTKKNVLPPILTLFTSRRMLAGFWATLVVASVLTGLDTTLALFVYRTFGWNSLATGILFLSVLLPFFFAPLIGGYIDKHGSRWVGAFGLLWTIPFFALLRLVEQNSVRQKVLLAGLLCGVGIGLALTLTALMAEFGKVCDAKEEQNPGCFGERGAYAQSYGIFNISWAAGGLVGAFWAGGIYNTSSWATLSWTWALLCGVSAVPVLLFTDGWVGKSCVGQWRGEKAAEEIPRAVQEGISI